MFYRFDGVGRIVGGRQVQKHRRLDGLQIQFAGILFCVDLKPALQGSYGAFHGSFFCHKIHLIYFVL